MFYVCTPQDNPLRFVCGYLPSLKSIHTKTYTFTNEPFEKHHLVIPAYLWLPFWVQRLYIKFRLIWELDIHLIDYYGKTF